MPSYVEIATSAYVALSEIKKKYPHISFPATGPDADTLASLGYAEVVATDAPTITSTQLLAEGVPTLVDGRWEQTWIITDMTADEIAIKIDQSKGVLKASIDAKRDSILAAGYVFTFNESEYTLQTRDDNDRVNWLGVLNTSSIMVNAGNGAGTTKIRTQSNDTIEVTYTFAQTLMLSTLEYQASVYQSAWDHKDAVNALSETDISEVEGYDITTGWPS